MRNFSVAERRARIARRHHLSPGQRATTVEDACEGMVCLHATDPASEPWAALLPGLDPTTMGWQSREWYLGPHASAVFDTNGNAGPTAWWNGRVVGGWTQRDGGEVSLQLLEDPGAEGCAALEDEAARLGAWLGGVRIPPRFPSPLSKAEPEFR